MRLWADSRHKKENGFMNKHSPRPCITMDRSKQVDQTGALWRAGSGTQEATGQLQMTDAKQAFISYGHLVWGLVVPQELWAACPRPTHLALSHQPPSQ